MEFQYLIIIHCVNILLNYFSSGATPNENILPVKFLQLTVLIQTIII